MTTTIIRIKNLRLRTFIGINDSERANRQDITVNVRIAYGGDSAAQSDAIEDACNYRTITKAIIELVENNKFLLLERLTADVLDLIMQTARVQSAEVEIDKPHALRFADSVSVQMSAQRD